MAFDEIDTDWQQFCDDEYEEQYKFLKTKQSTNITYLSKYIRNNDVAPKSNPLYISTQTKISFLNTPIDLVDIFWKLPIMPYYYPQEGIVKKEMKFNSRCPRELESINHHLLPYDYVEENRLTHIDNPTGRIKYKDVRKISIGLSKKNILSFRCKKKSAFYNSFVIVLRLYITDSFKEFHVKIFNTGKIELPGIKNNIIRDKVYEALVHILSPFLTNKVSLELLVSNTDTVLINSNFNCGYYIKRDVLNDIFKKKYSEKIRNNYDPCIYPGIQCEIYYNMDINTLTVVDTHIAPNIIKVSFMVFRTGSVLIVGKCSEKILHNTYEYLCDIFKNEYANIHEENILSLINNVVKKTRKRRMKCITVNN